MEQLDQLLFRKVLPQFCILQMKSVWNRCLRLCAAGLCRWQLGGLPEAAWEHEKACLIAPESGFEPVTMNNVAQHYWFRSAVCILVGLSLLVSASAGLVSAGTFQTSNSESSRAALIAIRDCHPPTSAGASDTIRTAGRVSGPLKWFAGIGNFNCDHSVVSDFLAISRYRASLESAFLWLQSGRAPPAASVLTF